MSDKHTPGPWRWQREEFTDYYVLGPIGSNCLTCVISDGSACGEYSPDIDVNSQDAKLLEAAPELFDELKRINACYEALLSDCGLGHEDAIRKAKDLIARIEG